MMEMRGALNSWYDFCLVSIPLLARVTAPAFLFPSRFSLIVLSPSLAFTVGT